MHSIAIAGATHLPFLREMLYEAAHWRSDSARPPLEEALAHPELVKWIADWGQRHGDFGVVAIDPGDRLVGAAWYRFWTDDHHSYGYVDSTVPELAIGVVTDMRGRGVGKTLLTGLIAGATERGVQQLSLSVEKENPAAELYRQFGFREVRSLGNAWTMLADVPRLDA